jgi:hypothetical protein
MAATAKLFQRTFIQTKPGVEKRHYLEQFASLAFSATPNGVYSAEIEIAPNQAPPTPRDFVELLIGSEHVDAIPMVPAGTDPPTKFEDLSPEVRRAYEIYPLVDGETVISINMLCLDKDWEGMRPGTVFINRETNLSRAYFAAPGLRADPHTPGVTPALLSLRIPPAPVLRARLTTALTRPSTPHSASSTSRSSRSFLTPFRHCRGRPPQDLLSLRGPLLSKSLCRRCSA